MMVIHYYLIAHSYFSRRKKRNLCQRLVVPTFFSFWIFFTLDLPLTLYELPNCHKISNLAFDLNFECFRQLFVLILLEFFIPRSLFCDTYKGHKFWTFGSRENSFPIHLQKKYLKKMRHSKLIFYSLYDHKDWLYMKSGLLLALDGQS